MPILDLTIDEVLTTTRAVRKRLDLTRPVEHEVIRECLTIALQAPTPGSQQNWHFIVVTDQAQREALGAMYRKGAREIGHQDEILERVIATASDADRGYIIKMADAARYLTNHIHEVPVLVVPCLEGRLDGMDATEQAAQWGGIWPATWSFMLAARSRGLGSVLTTLHLGCEKEAADVLGIPYDKVMQVGLIPVAYTKGTHFKPAERKPLDTVLHWDRW